MGSFDGFYVEDDYNTMDRCRFCERTIGDVQIMMFDVDTSKTHTIHGAGIFTYMLVDFYRKGREI